MQQYGMQLDPIILEYSEYHQQIDSLCGKTHKPLSVDNLLPISIKLR